MTLIRMTETSETKAATGMTKRRRVQSFKIDPNISYKKWEPIAPSTLSLMV